MQTAIWWIRRDLRLADNVALTMAITQAQQVIPLFILDPTFSHSTYVGEKRWAFLYDGLRQLDASLRQRGSYLLLRQGNPIDVLQQLQQESGANLIIAEADSSVYARRRDQKVSAILPLTLVSSTAIQKPGTILKPNGTPYVVYTPFKKKWHQQPWPRRDAILPTPTVIKTPNKLTSQTCPLQPNNSPFLAGEAEAQRRLETFMTEHIYHYNEQRDLMAIAGTSELSPYLRFGMISARETAVTALEAIPQATTPTQRDNAQKWLDQLIWRDFYIHILHHFPHVSQENFRPVYNHLVWRNDQDAFQAWCAGQTGYPIVDAAMRQLQAIGWMHNRARMIVASFLVKDLLIDWRWGERWFMQHLVDGDPAANNGGWQWVAGTGTDAAPYFRIFNPLSQSRKFDPNGVYIRRWLPELMNIPTKYIHEPQQMPLALQKAVGCIVGQDYPSPIVNHKVARQQTLLAYKEAKRLYDEDDHRRLAW